MTPCGVNTEEARDSEIERGRSTTHTQGVAETRVIEQEVRAETDRLLIIRTRIMLAMVAGGVAVGLATDWYLGRFLVHPRRQLLQILGLGAFLGLMQAIPRWGRRVSVRLLAFVAAAAPCALLAVFSIEALSEAERVNLVGYTVITLGTAILLPWGIWAQVALTGVVVASILAGAVLAGGRFPDPGTIPALAVAIGLSYFVSLVLERNRLVLARQRRELAVEKELAEERRIGAEALAQDLDAYAHTVAHDLKNPVGVISGYSELLQVELAGRATERAQELLQATARGCEKMAQIIDELLLLASVRKSLDVASEPLDMSQIVLEARKRLAAKIDERKAEIVIPDDWPQALGHAPWVEEVWANYVSNAIKYGGSPPRVELGADPDGDGKVHFWVRDNGNGLNQKQLSMLFKPFSRAEPGKAEGHGLGLSIVKRIVERLGGRVRVTSTVGEGSTFGFTLPATRGTPAEETIHP